MKKPSLSRKSRFKNGIIPANKLKKFVPTKTSTSFVFRSSYEYLFGTIFCEKNPSVQSWSSEPYSIPYFDIGKNKNRQYFIDFSFTDVSGQMYIVEVKDSKEVEAVKKFRKHLSTIENPESRKQFSIIHANEATNLSKWMAAKKYAKANNYQFIIADEKYINKIAK